MSNSQELYNIIHLQNKRLHYIEEQLKKIENNYKEQNQLLKLLRNLNETKNSDIKNIYDIAYIKPIFDNNNIDINKFHLNQNEILVDDNISIPDYLFNDT